VVRPAGIGSGGLVATLRCPWRRLGARLDGVAAPASLPAARDGGGVHVIVADPEASRLDAAERRASGGDTNTQPSGAILVEGWGTRTASANPAARASQTRCWRRGRRSASHPPPLPSPAHHQWRGL